MDDRNEIFGGIECEPGQISEHRIRAQAAHEQRVAVGRRARGRFGAERSCAAGAVFHHHRLARRLAQSLRDDPRQRIGKPARRERHDDLDGLCGIILGARGSGRDERHGAQRSRE